MNWLTHHICFRKWKAHLVAPGPRSKARAGSICLKILGETASRTITPDLSLYTKEESLKFRKAALEQEYAALKAIF